MIVDIFLISYTFFLLLVSIWAGYSSYLVIKCGVPPVPTNKNIAQAMIQAASIKKTDTVYDLGCGFGTVLFGTRKHTSAQHLTGYEINKPVLWWAQAKNKLLKTNIQFISDDFFRADLRQADVIFCYLWPSIMDRIKLEIWPNLKPGTRIVSHGFRLPKTTPNQTIQVGRSQIFVYVKT